MSKREFPRNFRLWLVAYLKAAREAEGLSQQRLARLLEMDRSYVAKVERGDINLSLATLDRMLEQLVHSAGPLPRFSDTVGPRLRQCRSTRMSQERFAELAGVSISQVSNLERGVANASVDRIENLATILGMSAEDVFSL